MPLAARHVLIGLAVVALQWLVLGRLRLWGAYPDAILLYTTWLALRFGRLPGMVSGFALGLVMDALYGTWGVQMFAKTTIGFMVGVFPADERAAVLIRPQQAFIGGMVIALLHNGLQVIFYALQAGTRTSFLIAGLWIGSAVYTAAVGTIATLFTAR